MRHNTDARADVLRSIRQHLAASARHDARVARPAPMLPVFGDGSVIPTQTTPDVAEDQLRRFAQQLHAVGARCTVVRDEAEAASLVAQILRDAAARDVVASDAPLVRRLVQATEGEFNVRDIAETSQDELFACDAGVTTAHWGIAQTGTLLLESAREQSRLASLVPRLHIAILDAADICATIGDALARVRYSDRDDTLANRAITLITGPSRTSDIELTLVIGVHGPQLLHVIVLDTRTPEVVLS